MLVIKHFRMEFPRLAVLLTTAELLEIAAAIQCQDYAYLHFENKKKKKFYHKREQLLRAVRHGYHEYKNSRVIILEYLLKNKEEIQQRVKSK